MQQASEGKSKEEIKQVIESKTKEGTVDTLPASKVEEMNAKEDSLSGKEEIKKDGMGSLEFEFEVGENLLCYHGPLLYEAKVMKREIWNAARILKEKNSNKKGNKSLDTNKTSDEPGIRYRVHYKGWKNRWDEWVTTARVLRLNPKNLELQKELTKKITNSTKQTRAKSPVKSNLKPTTPASAHYSPKLPGLSLSPAPDSRGRKRNSDVAEIRSKRLQAAKLLNEELNSPSENLHDLNVAHSNFTSAQSEESSSRLMNNSISGGTKNEEDIEINQAFSSPPVPKIKIELNIPDSLKLFLVDQWDNITRYQKLVQLPRKPSVRQILELYRNYAINKFNSQNNGTSNSIKHNPNQHNNNHSSFNTNLDTILDSMFSGSSNNITNNEDETQASEINLINEIVDGLAIYFVKTVGSFLLYRFERPQHIEILTTYPKASESQNSQAPYSPNSKKVNNFEDHDLLDIYGAEHLLRLFVHLPYLLSHANVDLEGQKIIQDKLNDLLAFLDLNKDIFFSDQYDNAPPSYTQQIRSE